MKNICSRNMFGYFNENRGLILCSKNQFDANLFSFLFSFNKKLHMKSKGGTYTSITIIERYVCIREIFI